MTDEWCVNPDLDSRPPDIVVNVESCQFKLHKDVLIENCDYFKAMFSSQMIENLQDVITIKLVKKHPFEILIQGFYSGQLSLTVENIFEVTLSAHILQVSDVLFEKCCGFMISIIDQDNCFDIMYFSEFHNLQKVYNVSRRYCLFYFCELYKCKSLCRLDISQLEDYLCDEFLVADGECERILALSNWCRANDSKDFNAIQIGQIVNKIIEKSDDTTQLCKKIIKLLTHKKKPSHQILNGLKRLPSPPFQELMMFWARLTETTQRGLVDVIKLDIFGVDDDKRGIRVDTMTNIVEKPGYDVGSAVCAAGPYVYICGGGPHFGRMDWIREIWKYNIHDDEHRWTSIGTLPYQIRYHSMLFVDTKLYIFGGFGKFRAKNMKLDSFDVVTGEWKQHASVPTWEIKPASTSHYRTIFMVCRMWKVYAYSIDCDQWTTMNVSDPTRDVLYGRDEPYNELSLSRPLFCSATPLRNDPTVFELLVVSQGQFLQTHKLLLDIKSNSFRYLSDESKHEVDFRSFSYLCSCAHESKIAIFIQKISEEEKGIIDMNRLADDDAEEEHIPIFLNYLIPESGTLQEGIQINNLQGSLCAVSVPLVPETFPIPGS